MRVGVERESKRGLLRPLEFKDAADKGGGPQIYRMEN